MTRNDKLRKLANAVRAYRGVTDSQPGAKQIHWRHTPQPSRQAAVCRWLDALGLDPRIHLPTINAFSTYEQFDRYLAELGQPQNHHTTPWIKNFKSA